MNKDAPKQPKKPFDGQFSDHLEGITFQEKYDGICPNPECGKNIKIAPSIFMKAFGMNSGQGSCAYCKQHCMIELNDEGTAMNLIPFKEWKNINGKKSPVPSPQRR